MNTGCTNGSFGLSVAISRAQTMAIPMSNDLLDARRADNYWKSIHLDEDQWYHTHHPVNESPSPTSMDIVLGFLQDDLTDR